MNTDNPIIQRWLEPAAKTPRLSKFEIKLLLHRTVEAVLWSEVVEAARGIPDGPGFAAALEQSLNVLVPDSLRNARLKTMFDNPYTGKGDHPMPDGSLGDHPYYQSPASGETSQQATDRRNITPVQWTEHSGPGPLCLGPNFAEIIAAEIQLAMDNIQAKQDTAKGVIDYQENAEYIRATFENNLAGYARHCASMRSTTPHSFDWQYETIDRVRSAMASPYFRPKDRKAKPAESSGVAGPETILIKPEYQGANHPLQVSQVDRKSNPVGPTFRALSALKQFEETGRITAPDNTQDRIAREVDHQHWLDTTPASIKPVRKAEPINALLHDVCGPKSAQREYLDIEDSDTATDAEKQSAFETFMASRP